MHSQCEIRNILVAMLMVLANVSPVCAAIAKDEDPEVKQQAFEDSDATAKAGATDSTYLGNVTLRGHLSLSEPPDDSSPVLGTFTTRAKKFEVKIAREGLRQELKNHNGKDVTLEGKLRNEGKYFIVDRIPGGVGAPPVDARARRGL